MELLEFPNRFEWGKRKIWVEELLDESLSGSESVSDHAAALFLDLQACYCIGAWLSVIILSVSVIDAHLRETEALDDNIGTAKLLAEFYRGEDIDWLRKLRNKYVHLDMRYPSLVMNAQFENRNQFEAEATQAFKMVIKAFSQGQGT